MCRQRYFKKLIVGIVWIQSSRKISYIDTLGGLGFAFSFIDESAAKDRFDCVGASGVTIGVHRLGFSLVNARIWSGEFLSFAAEQLGFLIGSQSGEFLGHFSQPLGLDAQDVAQSVPDSP